MKRFNNISNALTVLCFVLIASIPARAQEWSPAQKEVWKVVEEMNLLWSKGDIGGLYKFVHRDHVWWGYNTAVPMESAKRFDDVWAANNKVVEYALKPLTILAYDSFAVVNYVWAGIEMATGEKPKYATYRATEVYKKEGTKWLLVANHGGGYGELK